MKKQDLIEILSRLPDDIEIVMMSPEHLRKGQFRFKSVNGWSQSEVAPDYSAGFNIYKHLQHNESSKELKAVAILY